MKRAIAVWLACLLAPAVIITAVALAQNQQPAVVSVSVTAAAVRDGTETRTDVLLLWNRNIRSTPIGHAVKSCVKGGRGGIFGNGLMSCVLTLNMPEGKVIASGVVHGLDRYTLAITGGTGSYVDARGPLFVRRIGDGLRRLTFRVG